MNLCERFQRNVVARGRATAISMAGHRGLSWREYAEQVRRLAPGFAAFGARAGAAVPVLMGSRPEFHAVDTALLLAGATPYSLEVGGTVQAAVGAVALTGSTLLVTETAHLEPARAVSAQTGVELVCVDGRSEGTIGFDDLAGRKAPSFDALWYAVGDDDTATLVLTADDTGALEAVGFSHRAIVASELSTDGRTPFADPDGAVLHLPPSRLDERWRGHYAQLVLGLDLRLSDGPTLSGRGGTQPWSTPAP